MIYSLTCSASAVHRSEGRMSFLHGEVLLCLGSLASQLYFSQVEVGLRNIRLAREISA